MMDNQSNLHICFSLIVPQLMAYFLSSWGSNGSLLRGRRIDHIANLSNTDRNTAGIVAEHGHNYINIEPALKIPEKCKWLRIFFFH